MPEQTGIPIHHPETGRETYVEHERQVTIYERSGWRRGPLPDGEVSDATATPTAQPSLPQPPRQAARFEQPQTNPQGGDS